MKYWKEAKGFILAPLIPSGAFALLATGAGLISGIKDGIDPFTYLFGGLIWFVSALPVAYSATILLGMPGYVLYRKKSINSLKAYLLGGILLGIVSPVLLLVIFEWSAIIGMGWLLFAISSCFGVITSYSFWRIVVKSPNHTLHPTNNRDAVIGG